MRMAVHKICSRFSRGGGGAVNSSGNYLNCTRSDCASSVPETSSSTSVTDTVRGSHDFDVNGYSLVKGMGVGKYVASTTFNVGGYDWAVYFYPDGKGPEDNSTYVSLFIALASEGSDVRALFELTLLDQSGNGKHKTHTHFDRTLESGPYTLKYRGSMWGYKRFFRRSALETSDYLKDDRLSIKCTVGVVGSHIETTKIYTLPSPASCIGSEFGSLLETGTASDVEFTVDGETFKAHRLVLAARSPVFKAQFLGPLKDPNTKNVQVDDIEAPIFKGMLHFIYHDSLPDIQALVDSTSTSTTAMAFQHLLVAADRYGLDRLRLLCEAKLCEEMTLDTVATTLTLAEQHQCFQLKAVCLKFLTSVPGRLRGVMQTDGFEYLKQSCPALLSELLESIVRHERISVISKPLFKVFDGSDSTGRRVRQRIM